MNIITSLFGRLKNFILQNSAVRRAFGVEPEASATMEQNINLWYAMYINQPPWETKEIVPLGLPGAICRELSRTALVEFTANITGSARADYLNEQFQAAIPKFLGQLELGLAVGGIAFRPVLYGDRLLVDATSATAFTPTKFGPDGACIGGVFRDKAKCNGKYYARMEYHSLTGNTYTIQNKAYNSDSSGSIRDEVPLNTVPEWADIAEEVTIQNVQSPLFAYFKVPKANNIEPDSMIGVSIYSGAAVDLIKRADEQWDLIRWEYKSGQRKIFMDRNFAGAPDFDMRLFEFSTCTKSGDFYQEFSPEFRDTQLYNGLQNILRRIEQQVGLSYEIISEPREKSNPKTATEVTHSKEEMFATVNGIQTALANAFDTLIYGMDVYATLYNLAPAGSYEVSYDWGDSVLYDEDAKDKDRANDRQDVAMGTFNDWEYRAKWRHEDEATAKRMLPRMEDMTSGETQEEVE